MPSTQRRSERQSSASGKTTGSKKKTSAKAKTPAIDTATPAELDAMDVKKLWKHYDESDHPERLRNYFMERYLPLVRYNAERIYARLPDEVDIEDLMSAGLFGLMDAIDAFDLERGVKFETYCAQRIRGAIFDELRAMDWVPRLVRSRTAKVDARPQGAGCMELGRKPTDAETLRSHLNVDKSEESKKLERNGLAPGRCRQPLNRKWRRDGLEQPRASARST